MFLLPPGKTMADLLSMDAELLAEELGISVEEARELLVSGC